MNLFSALKVEGKDHCSTFYIWILWYLKTDSVKMSADFLFCKQITEKNSTEHTEHTWNLKFEDFFTICEKMGKAKKLKISKAPRNTPLEENITKVRLFLS